MKKNEVVLGVGAFGHDASACIVEKMTGKVLFAVAEERYSNVKHDRHFPIMALSKCEEFAKSNACAITDVAINFDDREYISGLFLSEFKTVITEEAARSALFNKIADIYLIGDSYVRGGLSFELIEGAIREAKISKKAAKEVRFRLGWYFNWAKNRSRVFNIVKERYSDIKVHRVPHHVAHAASAFLNSGYEEAAIVTLDGWGEIETGNVFKGNVGEGLSKLSASYVPNSLGAFYLDATKYLGFGAGDEYKVMGMSAYGEPRFYDLLRSGITVGDDGSIIFADTVFYKRMQKSRYIQAYSMDFTPELSSHLKRRKSSSERLSQVHFDFAASIQKITEEVGVEVCRAAAKLAQSGNIAIAGGVGLNGLMNERIRQQDYCESIFVYPAAGDDGTSVGAAQYVSWVRSNDKKAHSRRITSCYYGASYGDEMIEKILKEKSISYQKPSSIEAVVAKSLAAGSIVARYRESSEYGPRALGNRSILANPCLDNMKDILNVRIKHREPFRPFAPVCLREKVNQYFEIDEDSPFMLQIVKAKAGSKSTIPSVVHNDDTARVQTVTLQQNPDLYKIIQEFEGVTGVPIIINTSFNVNGETIVESPLDAIESFGHMDIDYLAIGPFWVSKKENSERFEKLDDASYLKKRNERYKSSAAGFWRFIDLDRPYCDRPLHITVLREVKKLIAS